MAKKNSTAESKKSGAIASTTRKETARNLHVIPQIEGWGIRSEGSTRVSSIHSTKREAIEAGRALAKRAAITLVIHGRDGRVTERNSFKPHPIAPPEPRKVLYPTTSPRTASKAAIKKAVSEVISEGSNGSSATKSGSQSGHQRRSQVISKRDSRH